MRHVRSLLVAGCFGLALVGGSPIPASPASRADLERIVTDHYPPEFLERAEAYHRVRLVLFFVQLAVTLGVLGWLVAGPLGRWGGEALALGGGRPWLGRLVVLTAIFLVFALIRLPFGIIRFVHAHNYGLRHDSWSGFLLDWAKGLGIGWVMLVAVGLIVLGLFAAFPRAWWLLAGSAVAVLTVGYVMVAPLVIDPLFHRFKPLEDEALAARLLELGHRAGVDASEILVADASRRTRAVNAYFTGFGNTQRIVLYDTLVEKFDADEVAMVLAHEAGHWKLRHIRKGLVMGIAAVFLGLLVAHLVLGRLVATGAGGLAGRADPGLAVPAYALYVILMLVALVPSNWISRRMESEADRASLELTRDPETFIRTETRLAEENLSDVLPPAWVEFTLYTHPSNARRIHMAEQFQ